VKTLEGSWTRLRPCRSFCQTVEQRCPYFLPGDRAPAYPTQYAGEPTFLCRGKKKTREEKRKPRRKKMSKLIEMFIQIHSFSRVISKKGTNVQLAPCLFRKFAKNSTRHRQPVSISPSSCSTTTTNVHFVVALSPRHRNLHEDTHKRINGRCDGTPCISSGKQCGGGGGVLYPRVNYYCRTAP